MRTDKIKVYELMNRIKERHENVTYQEIKKELKLAGVELKAANSNVGSKEVHILCGIYEMKFEELWPDYILSHIIWP